LGLQIVEEIHTRYSILPVKHIYRTSFEKCTISGFIDPVEVISTTSIAKEIFDTHLLLLQHKYNKEKEFLIADIFTPLVKILD
jgi:hypothetical protein